MNFSICRVQERIVSVGIALEIDEISQRITGCLRLQGTSGGHLQMVQLSLLKQRYVEMVAQDHIQTAFEYAQGGKLPSSLGNLCQCSVTLMLEIVFPDFQTELPEFIVCPLPAVLSPVTTAYRLSLSSAQYTFYTHQ